MRSPPVVDPRKPQDPWWRERVAHRSLPSWIGARLRDERKLRGWSYPRAQRELDVSRGALWLLEECRRRPSLVVAELLIRGYGLDARTAAGLREVARPYSGRSYSCRTGIVPRRD